MKTNPISVSNMIAIANNLNEVTKQIKQAADACGRDANEIRLLAVSKKMQASAIEQAYVAGQRCFGENYVQEALTKMNQLASLDIEWHFIGSIQSNKCQEIAKHFQWVHTVDRLKIAQRLNHYRTSAPTPLNICIQVNLDDELNKSGIQVEACEQFAKEVEQLPNLTLRGLMTIPKRQDDFDGQLNSFQRLTELKQVLQSQLSRPLDTLSMGMSADLNAAIFAGSTLVRVGEAIFGARK